MTKFRLVVSLLFIIVFCNAFAGDIHGDNIDNIYSEFSSAPDSSRTKVSWFNGETETTREGITADLEAFKKAGVGGVVYYDQVHGDAKEKFSVFSPEWRDALKFSASEAKRLGRSFEINLSNGFVAGGPWITKRLSMKRLCKSEVMVDCGSKFDGVLPALSNDELPISDSWSVDFMLPSGRKIKMIDLKSWTEQSDEDIKYHSGKAIYNGSFATPSVTDKSKRICVCIRGLESVSKVCVNGHDAGYLWCSPWEVDVTEYLNHDTGNNIINIEVANQLTNRMIGDMKLPEDERVTYATTPIVKPDDELLPAGITGGVEIVVR